MPRKVDSARKLDELRRLLAGRSSMLIAMQDNPDPDALAAGAALRKLSRDLAGVYGTLATGAPVGRAENRAMLRYLDVRLKPLTEVREGQFDLIAMVDTQPGHGNTSLPAQFPVDIVIDHHPARPESRRAKLIDIRRLYGATSTILWEYLQAAGLEPDPPLATALLYGIRSDTQDFGRDCVSADMQAHGALYPLANKRMLGQIQRGQVSQDYFRTLYQALETAWYCERCIWCELDDLPSPEMVGEIADLLLRHELSDFSLCWGYHQGRLVMSLRSCLDALPADVVVRRLVGRRGSAGGHRTMAGGQIPLETDNPIARRRLNARIRRRYLATTAVDEARCRKLV